MQQMIIVDQTNHKVTNKIRWSLKKAKRLGSLNEMTIWKFHDEV